MLTTIGDYADFISKIRNRTRNYFALIPDDQLEWSPVKGKFTFGDLARHIIMSEKMFVGVICEGNWHYSGHESRLAGTKKELLSLEQQIHKQCIEKFLRLSDEVLTQKRNTLQGYPVSVWRVFHTLAEHEIHHRGELTVYLQMINVAPPQIFGIRVEEIPTA
ncbi:DinB family protein [Aneurinibacillus sp. Ricciae_BoGa-3]|uniref:DinB family protein n=1 Tax=Aneurinibacillus sp. Ricciae_BoGa-3 TaxID=3022697 RepID=UPI00233FC012|nr:DinB family protein [Aneurinibacillus sp. Ricciae_BoGa-3]WCK54946.1 DinB family protein [Aneurinibacillus sp. Ricciae_BoGa-3]